MQFFCKIIGATCSWRTHWKREHWIKRRNNIKSLEAEEVSYSGKISMRRGQTMLCMSGNDHITTLTSLSLVQSLFLAWTPFYHMQEVYNEGEQLGTLECGHDFHTDCIKQWLMHKNLCPICKTTALATWESLFRKISILSFIFVLPVEPST